MLLPLTISLLCAITGYLKPVTGFGLFLLFNTGLSGIFDKAGLVVPQLGPLQPGTLACVMAIFSLLIRKTDNSTKRSASNFILLPLWIFTFIALFSRIIELEAIFTTKIIWQIFYCMLWAPLFMTFQKMDSSQLYSCRRLVIYFSAITALVTVVIVITKSSFLYDIFATRSENIMKKNFMEARIIVHGLWTFMPLGMWYCFMELFKEQDRRGKNTVVYWIMAILMVLAVVINLTRFMMLGMVMGMMFTMLASLFVLPGKLSGRNIKITSLLTMIGIVVIILSTSIHSGWMERYEEAQLGGSIEGRIIRNEYVFKRLLNELPILGNIDHWSQEAQISRITGDPHTVLTVWTSYGLLASLTFAVLMLVVFVGLVKFYFSRKRYTQEAIFEWLFMSAFYIQFQWAMVSGDYLFEVTVFVLMLFLSDVSGIVTIANSRQPIHIKQKKYIFPVQNK